VNRRALSLAVLSVVVLSVVALITYNSDDSVRPVPTAKTSGGEFSHEPEVALSINPETAQPERLTRHEEMAHTVNQILIPILYASSDLDALIAGALLMHGMPSENYSEFDFLNLALSLDSDDELLLSILALNCLSAQRFREDEEARNGKSYRESGNELREKLGEYARQQELLCEGRHFIEELMTVTGDNAWVWLLRARREVMNADLSLEYLQRAVQATHYNDFVIEKRFLMMAAIQKYGGDIEDSEVLQLYGISKSYQLGSGFYDLCKPEKMATEISILNSCAELAQYMVDGPTLMDQMIGYAITMGAGTLREEPVDTSEFSWLDVYASDFYKLLQDPAAEEFFKEQLLRYSEVDAVKQTMIRYDLLEDTEEKPEEIRLDVIE